jgi:hypothetical protein
MMNGMDVELLVTYECPNEGTAVALLRLALNEVGLTGTRVRTTVVTSQEQAERLGFAGSPTILINGNDPFAAPGRSHAALACRIYRGPSGPNGPAGVPDLAALRRAVEHAAASSKDNL